MNKRAYYYGYLDKIADAGYDFKDLAKEYAKQNNIPKGEWANTFNEMKEKWTEEQRVNMARKLGVFKEHGGSVPPGAKSYTGRQSHGGGGYGDWYERWQQERGAAGHGGDRAEFEEFLKKIEKGTHAVGTGVGAVVGGLSQAFAKPTMKTRGLAPEQVKAMNTRSDKARRETKSVRVPIGAASGAGMMYTILHPKGGANSPLWKIPLGMGIGMGGKYVNQKILDNKFQDLQKQELPKAAAQQPQNPKNPNQRVNLGPIAAAGIAPMALQTAATVPAMLNLGSHPANKVQDKATMAKLKSLIEQHGGKYSSTPMPGHMAAFNPATDTVHVMEGIDPAVAAHEYGHLRNWKGGWKAPLLAARYTGMISPMAGLVSAAGRQDEKKARRDALISTGLATPMVGEEIGASVRGYNALSKLAPGMSRASKMKAFIGNPSYAAMAGMPLMAYGIKKGMGGYVPQPPQKSTMVEK